MVKGFQVGFGGHLHNVGAFFGDLPMSPPEKSASAGKVHGDTVAFDDHQVSLAGKSQITLDSVSVLHDGQFVIGVQGNYTADGVALQTTNIGSNQATMNQLVSLNPGEYISGVSGKGGDIIDSLTITTSAGNSYTFGGTGGNPFAVPIPVGKRVVGFHGGCGGHVHNIGVWYQ